MLFSSLLKSESLVVSKYFYSGSTVLTYDSTISTSEYSEIENVSINNVKIDYAEKLMDSNEREYYFWIITNIGKIENAKDIEKITISGI